MSLGSIPPALSLSRPLMTIVWQRIVDAQRAAAAELPRRRARADQRRSDWQHWQAVRHLSPHLLRDIGAHQLESWAATEHARDEWKTRTSGSGLG